MSGGRRPARDGRHEIAGRGTASRTENDREVMYFAYDRLGMPLLYADLMRFRKGPLRLQRLRTLVLLGLMAERIGTGAPQPQAVSSADAADVFAEPVDD